MKLIKPSFEIWNQPAGLEGVYKQIERVGRVCYKSEDKITEDSAKPFVDRMIKSGHGAMLEHGTVYLDVPNSAGDYNLVPFFASNLYSRVVIKPLDDRVHNYVTTNFRVIVENFAEEYIPDILQYLCEPTEFHEKRITVHFVCDRGVSHEFVRHRVMSFAQESTRYCNYSKDKFDNEITFIKPLWIKDELHCPSVHRVYDYLYNETYLEEKIPPQDRFIFGLEVAEDMYLKLVDSGWKPQEARAVLPNSLKTELVVTGFVSDWNHFFDLRARGTTGAPHPQAKELAEPLMKEFIARKYINN